MLGDGSPLPPLFNWSPDELVGVPIELRARLVPPHARTPTNWPAAVAAEWAAVGGGASPVTRAAADVGYGAGAEGMQPPRPPPAVYAAAASLKSEPTAGAADRGKK